MPCNTIFGKKNMLSNLGVMHQPSRTFVGWAKVSIFICPRSHFRKKPTQYLYWIQSDLELGLAKPEQAASWLIFPEPSLPSNEKKKSISMNSWQGQTAPILVYSPGQDRGWMIPKLPIIELMMSIHMDKYGFREQTAPWKLKDTAILQEGPWLLRS